MSELSQWTHAICDNCWDKRYRELKGEPTRLKKADLELCCFCKQYCLSGIYVRNDPTDRTMKCGGVHDAR